MKTHDESIDPRPQCELCQQETHSEASSCMTRPRLCPACAHQTEKLPGILVDSVARFLLGNVV